MSEVEGRGERRADRGREQKEDRTKLRVTWKGRRDGKTNMGRWRRRERS